MTTQQAENSEIEIFISLANFHYNLIIVIISFSCTFFNVQVNFYFFLIFAMLFVTCI